MYKSLLLVIIIISSCIDESHKMKTITEKQPYELEQHGDIRIDNYYWIRDDSRSDPKVVAYLENENDIANKWFKSKKDYQSDIVKELMEQVPDEEVTFPIDNNNYKYYQKIEKDDQLPRYFFKDKDNNEVLYLNPNLNLKNQNYYSIGSIAPCLLYTSDAADE